MCYIVGMNAILNILAIIGSLFLVVVNFQRLNAATTEIETIKYGVFVIVWAIFLGVSVIILTIENKKNERPPN